MVSETREYIAMIVVGVWTYVAAVLAAPAAIGQYLGGQHRHLPPVLVLGAAVITGYLWYKNTTWRWGETSERLLRITGFVGWHGVLVTLAVHAIIGSPL